MLPSIEERYKNMRRGYRQLQNEHKQLKNQIIALLEDPMRGFAGDEYDEGCPCTINWEKKMKEFVAKLKNNK